MNKFIGYIRSLLITVDEFFNAATGGHPHYTISQRLGYAARDGSKIACWLCKLLNIAFRQKDHCGDAIKDFPDNLPTDG